MRILKSLVLAAALVGVVGLSACGGPSGALKPVKTTEAQLDKLVDKLRTETFKQKAKKEPDIAGAAAAMPKALKVAYASAALDAASGATVLKDVKITPADNTAVGVSIAELKLWNLDTDLLKARLAGQRLAETAKLASRIEADNISAFGLETLMAPALDAYTGAVTRAAGDLAQDPALKQALDLKASKYDFTLAHAVFDDVVLRPYEVAAAKPAPAAGSPPDELAAMLPVLQQYAALSRAIGFNAVVLYDMKGDVAFAQGGENASMKMGISTIAYRGWRGWDVDLGVVKGMSYDVQMAMPASSTLVVEDPSKKPTDPPAPPPPARTITIKETAARSVVTDMRLDKAAGYLARGVMPPRTETNLMSVGLIRIDDTRVNMGGPRDMYAIGSMTLDLTHWHWLIPNAGRIKVDNMAYDVPGFVDFIKQTADQFASPGPDGKPASSALDVPPGLMEVLAKYGLDKPSFDFNFGWNWNPTAGDTTVDLAFGLDGYTRFDSKAALSLPDFKAVSDLIPDKGEPNEQALDALFKDRTAFKSAEANFVDEGGFEKGFAAAAEIARIVLPADNKDLAIFRNQTGPQLRGMSVSGAYMLADEVGKTDAVGRDLLRPFAAWLDKGGKVRTAMAPKTPIKAADLEKPGEKPAELVARLGLTVTHTPPPGTAKPKS